MRIPKGIRPGGWLIG